MNISLNSSQHFLMCFSFMKLSPFKDETFNAASLLFSCWFMFAQMFNRMRKQTKKKNSYNGKSNIFLFQESISFYCETYSWNELKFRIRSQHTCLHRSKRKADFLNPKFSLFNKDSVCVDA